MLDRPWIRQNFKFLFITKPRDNFVICTNCLKYQNNLLSIKHCTKTKFVQHLKFCRVLFCFILSCRFYIILSGTYVLRQFLFPPWCVLKTDFLLKFTLNKISERVFWNFLHARKKETWGVGRETVIFIIIIINFGLSKYIKPNVYLGSVKLIWFVEWQGFPWKCEQPLCTECEVPCFDCEETKINCWRRR
jgi:hypothetical protein